MRSDIVVVGSLNADLVTRLDRFPAPGQTVAALDFAVYAGGKGANQAYAAARLGGKVSMVGCLGQDAYGELLAKSLRDVGVNLSGVTREADAPTGVALIALDASGENQIVVVAGANARLDSARLEASESSLAAAAVVLLQLEVPLATVTAAARMAHSAGAIVILDPSPAQPLPRELLACVDYLTPNQSELQALAGGAAGREVDRAARDLASGFGFKVIVKMGEAGALLVDGDRQDVWPSVRVAAVDTTGAGDAFNAALAVALSEGRSLADAGRWAVTAGALCVSRAGAQPSMPTREEVEKTLGR
jgi:ribokinase